MAANRLRHVVQQLRTASGGAADAELLGLFLHHRDEAAFEALVRRHGEMVLGVCRRVLRNDADAEDAFQATFLVLARKAGALRAPQALGSWLYGVAYKAAQQARRAATRRRAAEAKARPRAETAVGVGVELREVLDRELAGLPEKYRAAVVLCDLEGKAYREAAEDLGCTEGTVASRLARGRALLARRLARHGLAPSAGVAAVLSPQGASAAVPAALVASTVRAAAGQAVAAPVAAVLEGVLRAMLLHKLRKVAGALLLFALLAAGTGLVLWASQAEAEAPRNTASGTPARTPREEVATATAEELGTAFFDKRNEAYLDEHFIGKKVRVTGAVYQVKRVGQPTTSYIAFMILNPPRALGFYFAADARKQLAPLGPYNKVVIEGLCLGLVPGDITVENFSQIVRFENCRLVRVEPNPRLRGGVIPAPGQPGKHPNK
jgi:RNA polymerase sigma factor (sigma-70 family)